MPNLLLDILNHMDQDWPEVAAEAATNPAYSPIPVLLSNFRGHSKMGSDSRKRKILVVYPFINCSFYYALKSRLVYS